MATHQIRPADEHLPVLDLPAGALDASHPDYRNSTGDDPPEIEPIEHRIRVDVIAAGGLMPQSQPQGPGSTYGSTRPLARQYIEQTLVETYEREARFFPQYADRDTVLEDAPAFLRDKLGSLYEEIETVRENRQDWYFELIPEENLDTIQGTLDTLTPLDRDTLHGVVIVPTDTDPATYADDHGLNHGTVIQEADLDNHATALPSEYGIGLPAPLLVGEFATDSTYAFLPWSDAVVCGCPYKQTNNWAVMCKHELAVASRLGQDAAETQDSAYVLPVDVGVQIPQRARRFVSPTIAARHTPHTPR